MRRVFHICRSACTWLKVETERGAAAVEYGLLAALIAVAIVGAVGVVGTNLTGVFQAISAKVHS